ncbi:Retrovirus-related Pol polyprotein from transposon RE1 [Bienertia sinuspersici]
MMAGMTCSLSCSNSFWFLDSGASDHICNDLSAFTTYHTVSNANNLITISDGRALKVQHIGSVSICQGIQLYNVLHVPEFKFNLISVHKLCKDLNCTLQFSSNECLVQCQQGPTIPLGSLTGGLYQVTSSENKTTEYSSSSGIVSSRVCNASVLSKSDQAKLWHLRLGHLPFSQIKHVIPDYGVNNVWTDCICQVCHFAKQTRLPFPVSNSTT